MTQTPDIPPVIESDERDYRDSGVPSTVAIAGHPLHPPLVTFPIASLVLAAGSDLGYWLTSDLFWAKASFWLLGVGLLSGLAAAIVGMSDFLKIGRVRKHTAGWAHMYINVTSLVLTLINFLLRFGSRTENIVYTGLLISVVVATL
ncbi:MAG: DUF2231 domain-containing protein, partial [Coleofasciculaceae cyanobacterium]